MSRVDSIGGPRQPPTRRDDESGKGRGATDAPAGSGTEGGGVERGGPSWHADRLAPVPPGTEASGTTRAPEETKAPELESPKDGYQEKGQKQDPSEQGKKLGGRDLRPPTSDMGRLTPQMDRLAGQEMAQLAKRFGADLGLMRPEVMPQNLPGKEQATRLWQFFGAYAEAAAQQGATKEGLEAFRQALENAGFKRFTDGNTQENGLNRAMWTLEAKSPEEARARLDQVDLHAPPEERLPEGFLTAKQDAKSELQQARKQEAQAQAQQESAQSQRAAGHPQDRPQEAMLQKVPGQDAMRVNMLAAQAAAAGLAQGVERDGGPEAGADRKGGRRGVLGSNTLFNVLHTLRGEGADSAVEKDKFDRMAFGAVLALAGIALAAIALVMAF